MLRKLLVSAILLTPVTIGQPLAENQPNSADHSPSRVTVSEDVSHGFPAGRLKRLDGAMADAVSKGLIPGAVILIARDGEVVHAKAFGTLGGAGTPAMPENAIFRLASMTKPIVTTAAMMLVERGMLSIDEPVTKHIPEFASLTVEVRGTDASGAPTLGTAPPARPMLIQDLMRHTSGLTYSFTGPATDPIRKAYVDQGIEQMTADLPADEMISRLAAIPLAHQPGTTFEYGVSTDVLGIILERVTGKRLDAILEEMIFRPLGMKDSGFVVKPGDHARLASIPAGDPLGGWLTGWLRVESEHPGGYLSGGGGMVSTARDYFRFAQMILDGGEFDGTRLLSRKSVELMLSDHLAGLAGGPTGYSGPGYGFGLGFAVRTRKGEASYLPGSTGDAMWFGVTGTTFVIDPEERLVAILLTQSPSTRARTRPLFRNLVYGAMGD
ncbi:beta-lactamase [Skermanella stibiiresistens SB22]|uniref:Beta-lactamase n=1 Tax=Skermanella stibiiresistens SB22 TaxID=1385369 RepID=W9HBM9_9PROT|nr:serine hydrolase domain-containing protein [Skermanella stibiiresistens]EWY41293.1 beta-lactamase [Skermanella stibiiresistens SB22]